MREIIEFWLLGLFCGELRSWPWLDRIANRRFINNAIRTVEPPRPYRLSTKASYTSWETLTDRTYSARERAGGRGLGAADTRRAAHALHADEVQGVTEVVGAVRLLRPMVDRRGPAQRPFGHRPKTKKIKEPRDITKNESTHEVDLAQVYGLTAADGETLRCRHDRALLAYQVINGEEYPPDLYRNGTRVKQFERLRIIGTDKYGVNRGELLAMGSDAGNTQIGYSMFNALFLRAHNKLARAIRADQIARGDEWDDDQVFAATRNVLIVVMIKLVIEEYINHLSPWAFQFKFDPEGFEKRDLAAPELDGGGVQPAVPVALPPSPQLTIGDKPHTLAGDDVQDSDDVRRARPACTPRGRVAPAGRRDRTVQHRRSGFCCRPPSCPRSGRARGASCRVTTSTASTANSSRWSGSRTSPPTRRSERNSSGSTATSTRSSSTPACSPRTG